MEQEPLLSLAQAQIVIDDSRIMALLTVLHESVNWWRADMAPSHAILDSTTRARAINNYWYWGVRQRLYDTPGVTFGPVQNQDFVQFDNQVLVRFKLLNDKLESSNYPTEQAENWVRQRQLPEFPPFARLHLGYRLDLLGRLISDAFIALPNGRAGDFNDWVWQGWGDRIDQKPTYGRQIQLFKQDAPASDTYVYTDYSQRFA